MTRCAEFWDKWEREPNFCGLSPQSISEIKGYLELRDKVIKMGVAKAVFYESCPSGACRPVLRLADDGTRTEATNYIISCLKRGEKVTQGDLKGFVDMRLKKEAVCKVTPKNEGEGTQMRTQEPAPVKESLPVAPVTLGDRLKSGDNTVTPAVSPDLNAISDSSGKVSPTSDKHVAAAKVTINPVIVPDTYRESQDKIRYHCVYPDGCAMRDKEPVLSPELCGACPSLRPLLDGKGRIVKDSPFKTGSQIKAGIAGEMFPNHIADANKTIQKVSPEEQKRIDKQRRIDIADQLVEAIGRDMPDMIRDILREHPTWNAADVFYMGVQVLHERKGKV